MILTNYYIWINNQKPEIKVFYHQIHFIAALFFHYFEHFRYLIQIYHLNKHYFLLNLLNEMNHFLIEQSVQILTFFHMRQLWEISLNMCLQTFVYLINFLDLFKAHQIYFCKNKFPHLCFSMNLRMFFLQYFIKTLFCKGLRFTSIHH